MKSASSLIVLFASVLFLGACARHVGAPNGGAALSPRADGGVDVGNMRSAAVPQTEATMQFPRSWDAADNGDVLKITNLSGSIITAQKAHLPGLVSPTPVSLQQYLNSQHPKRNYNLISINGLQGVRSNLADTQVERVSDIYLVSEASDLIHLHADLTGSKANIDSGEAIVSSIRVPYLGLPYPANQPKTVKLAIQNAYSFSGDCFEAQYGCRGVDLQLQYMGQTLPNQLTVGTGGYDHGRIIELGPTTSVPFDSVRVEGKDLVSPKTQVPLSDIYTVFTPKKPKIEKDTIVPKVGEVYLVRTISWPEEDLISKFEVIAFNPGKSVTLVYQKLAYVPKSTLKKQVEAMNQYTLKYEKPLSEGQVTLYNWSVWNNYFYASFNFEYSTSGNMFITGNNWDILYDSGCTGKPTLESSRSGAGIAQIIDVGTKNIDQISLNDFPNPNSFRQGSCGVPAIKGHTYIVYHYDYSLNQNDAAVFGAVHVMAVDPHGKWVQLKFRRLAVRPADHFQTWISLGVPQGSQSVTLDNSTNQKLAIYYPFINKRGDQGFHYYEELDAYFSPDGTSDYLGVDGRPFVGESGFIALPPQTRISEVTKNQLESMRSRSRQDVRLSAGAVYGVVLENFYDETIFVIRVEQYTPGHSVTLSIRDIYRAKTIYSDDKN